MLKIRRRLLALSIALASAGVLASNAPSGDVSRLVVQFRQQPPAPADAALQASRSAKANAASGRAISRGAVITLDKPLKLTEVQQLATRMRQADPNILSVEPDVPVKRAAPPSDPHVGSQWGHLAPSNFFGAARLFDAWPLAGGSRIIVAVADTGSQPHPDITANEVAGFDFIGNDSMSGDGQSGRDNDPTDPGDYCASDNSPSSWHGLKVASLIGALANNGRGIAGGAANNVSIQHLRVLGRCGGWLSDIADAVTWASGGSVAGLPANSTPARVVNLSLSTPPGTSCPSFMQAAVNDAISRGTVVVAAAGNDGVEGLPAPANCNGVIAVGAHTASGDLASYSNRSSQLTLTAPGGGYCASTGHSCQNWGLPVLGNDGTAGPGAPVDMVPFAGTSAAAPHVSAAVALMLARNPVLTPEDVRAALVESVRPHAADTICATRPGLCGSGMLDAYQAMGKTDLRIVVSGATDRFIRPGATVTVSATARGGLAPYAYQWSQLSGGALNLGNPNQAEVSFQAPTSRQGDHVLRIRATDAAAASVSRDMTFTVNSLPQLNLTELTGTPGEFTRELVATDPDGDPVEIVLVGGPSGMALHGNQLTWNMAYPGLFDVALRLSDGREEREVTLRLTIPAAGGGSGGGASSFVWVAGLALAAAIVAAVARKQRKS